MSGQSTQTQSGGSATRVPIVLLVEDNPADIRLAQEVFRMAGFAHDLQVARDGEQALALLRQGPGFENAKRPDLILLDLNLPRLDGRAVLREIKSDPVLLRIPVIVLSTSKAESDLGACYDAHANCYLAKPVDIDEFTRLVALIREFWFGAVQLPPR